MSIPSKEEFRKQVEKVYELKQEYHKEREKLEKTYKEIFGEHALKNDEYWEAIFYGDLPLKNIIKIYTYADLAKKTYYEHKKS